MGLRNIVSGCMVTLVTTSLSIMPTIALSQGASTASVFEVLLMQSLEPCYAAPRQPLEKTDEITLSVALDAYGDMEAMPVLTNVDPLSIGEVALQKATVLALIQCTPMQSEDREKGIVGVFNITANTDGISLSQVDVKVIRVGLEDQNNLVISVAPEADDPQDIASTEGPESEAGADMETTTIDGSVDAGQPEDGRITLEGGTEETEAAMELTRSERIEIQRRLTILGYSTRGIDGIFGPATRGSIGIWQINSGNKISGYLNEAQLEKLRFMTKEEYSIAPTTNRQYYVDRNGCLRSSNGVIITGRTFGCDMNAAGQSLGWSK